MPLTIAGLAPVLQTLFTADADRLAAQTKFCRRRRALTGSAFAQALTFGWMARPDAPVEELAADLPIRAPALDARFTDAAADFLKALLGHAIAAAPGGRPEAIPLLRGFRGVDAEDMTDLGEGAGKALVRHEVTGGALDALEVLPASASEVPSSRALPPLPPGALRSADRGFFDGGELRRLSERGVRWVTRVPTAVGVRPEGAAAFEPLAGLRGDTADAPVEVSASDPAAGRLVARR